MTARFVAPDLRSHLVYSLMVMAGFFKDYDSENHKKADLRQFNKDFFFLKLKEAEDYVQGFLHFKEQVMARDLYLNVCGLSYAKKILNLNVPDESSDRTYLISKSKITNKLSVKKRLEVLKPWIEFAGYEV